MAYSDIVKIFLQRMKEKRNFNEDSKPAERYSRESGSSCQSRILDIERAERAKRAALIQCAERLWDSKKTQSDAVLERLGLSVQHDAFPSPPPSVCPRRRPESSLRGGKIRPISEENNRGRTPKINRTLEDEEPFFEKKLHLGSQMAILACKVKKVKDAMRSPSPDSSLSSVDTHTPSELRALSHLGPTPPPAAATRRPSRLPVMTLKLSDTSKKVAGGFNLQTAQTKFEKIAETINRIRLVNRHSSQAPAAPRRTPAVALKVPKPAPKAAPPKRGPCHGAPAVKPKVPAPPPKATPANRKGPRRGSKLRPTKAVQEDLKPLVKPEESLSLCFQQLSSDEWEKKLVGLKSIRALAQHHPALLKTKLHEVCLILTQEVNNLRSAVALAAMDTVTDLHVHLGRLMDPEAERTAGALLLKLAQTTNVFIHQQANFALDALVDNTNPARIINVLLNTGLSHGCAAVRGSTAQHLQQLVDLIGEDQILTAGKIFAERFLIAVSKMAVDAAPEVRHHGQNILEGLAHQEQFHVLWDRVIPVKDRGPLQKILQKMRQ